MLLLIEGVMCLSRMRLTVELLLIEGEVVVLLWERVVGGHTLLLLLARREPLRGMLAVCVVVELDERGRELLLALLRRDAEMWQTASGKHFFKLSSCVLLLLTCTLGPQFRPTRAIQHF